MRISPTGGRRPAAARLNRGLVAAKAIRGELPEVGVLVLSQYVEERYAVELLADSAESVGYLLKDRVADLANFVDAVRRVASGVCVRPRSRVAHARP